MALLMTDKRCLFSDYKLLFHQIEFRHPYMRLTSSCNQENIRSIYAKTSERSI